MRKIRTEAAPRMKPRKMRRPHWKRPFLLALPIYEVFQDMPFELKKEPYCLSVSFMCFVSQSFRN